MQIEIFSGPDEASKGAAIVIASEARDAVAERGRFAVAFSGGETPWLMLRALADEDVPWDKVHILQVDERAVPASDPARNFADLHQYLLAHAAVPPANVHAMPVEEADLEAAAAQYACTLESVAGTPPVLDLVHLGLGSDGHTASLVPGDPALGVAGADVAVTGPYEGHRRMTLTYPILNRARRILWLVIESGKAGALARLRAGDRSIPAGRVRRDTALILADRAAAGQPDAGEGLR